MNMRVDAIAEKRLATVGWYAVRTKPGGEYLAESEMKRLGLECYFPQFRREYRHHRSKRWIVRAFPLFQGYVFTPAIDTNRGALNECDGLVRGGLLCDLLTGKPVIVPAKSLKAIRDREEAGTFDEMKNHGLRLKPGNEISITDGPLVGLDGVIASVKSARNVRVLLQLFNGEVIATGTLAKIDRKG